MLARNFRSAAENGIGERQQAALITLLGMMERGEIHYLPDGLFLDQAASVPDRMPQFLNMNYWHCGTVACFGGWSAALAGDPQLWDAEEAECPSAVMNLFYPPEEIWREITGDQAIWALHTFLTTGVAEWLVNGPGVCDRLTAR